MILVNRPGTYDVVYNCRAVDDTPALSATRTVWVSEYFAPGCDQVTVTASHGAGPSLAGGVGAAGASVDVRYPPPPSSDDSVLALLDDAVLILAILYDSTACSCPLRRDSTDGRQPFPGHVHAALLALRGGQRRPERAPGRAVRAGGTNVTPLTFPDRGSQPVRTNRLPPR